MRLKQEKDSIPGTKYSYEINYNGTQNDGPVNIYAYLKDDAGHTVGKTMRKAARSMSEATKKGKGLKNALVAQAKSKSTQGRKATTKTYNNTVIDKEIEKMRDAGFVFRDARAAGSKRLSWNKATHRSVYTYWLGHGFSVLVYQLAQSSDPAVVLMEFRKKLITETMSKMRSKKNLAIVTQGVDVIMRRADILYRYLRLKDPTLPDVQLHDGNKPSRAYQAEQVKQLPDDMCQYFTTQLENRIATEPEFVLCSVLMYDAALRTAEAAGIMVDCIIICPDYAVIKVKYQEVDGERVDVLKTDDSYRITITSYWAKEMIRKCIAALGLKQGNTRLLVSAKDLSSWIRNLLRNYNKEFIDFAQQVELSNPDYINGVPVYDISAYVLRRNAASRWINYDGLDHDVIDALLGHKPKNQQPVVYLMDESEQKTIAKKLERYVYNVNCTRNPSYYPIEVSNPGRLDLEAACAFEVQNSSDRSIFVKIDITSCSPGGDINAEVPSGSIKMMTNRSIKFEPKSRNVIATNKPTN